MDQKHSTFQAIVSEGSNWSTSILYYANNMLRTLLFYPFLILTTGKLGAAILFILITTFQVLKSYFITRCCSRSLCKSYYQLSRASMPSLLKKILDLFEVLGDFIELMFVVVWFKDVLQDTIIFYENKSGEKQLNADHDDWF